VTKRHPGLVLRFGGHAAAAGLTLRESDFAVFRAAFEDVTRSLITAADLERQVETDGSLDLHDATIESARTIARAVWGQGFPEPCFFDGFEVIDQRLVGGRHARLKLSRSGRAFEGMLFGTSDPVPQRIEAVYRLDVNEFNGMEALQLTLQHWRPLTSS
jgi:single-stranded-DNA-specific exonuclease